MGNILKNNKIDIQIRVRTLKCYIWSTLLHGCESWTVSKNMEARIKAAEMWFYRRMLRIFWVARISNGEVLKRAGMKKELLEVICKRQLSFLGHI